MFLNKNHEQTIIKISQGNFITSAIDSFLIDRQARELSQHTLRFYREFLRCYFLAFGEKHNSGGVHGAYRTLRAFFQWLMKEEVMAPDWNNPMLKVKAPKVILDPRQVTDHFW
jgi:site-specific recombinase XerD